MIIKIDILHNNNEQAESISLNDNRFDFIVEFVKCL